MNPLDVGEGLVADVVAVARSPDGFDPFDLRVNGAAVRPADVRAGASADGWTEWTLTARGVAVVGDGPAEATVAASNADGT